MSGHEAAREKDNVAAIMRAKQAAGMLSITVMLLLVTDNVHSRGQEDGGYCQEVKAAALHSIKNHRGRCRGVIWITVP